MAVTTSSGNGFALYNGVKLPKIDSVWDKETYPYCVVQSIPFISLDLPYDGNFYTVYFISAPCGVASVPNGSGRGYCIDSSFSSDFACITGGMTFNVDAAEAMDLSVGVWSVDVEGFVTTGFADLGTLWASYTVQDFNNNTTLIEATDPIPLDGYTVIEWDGDTTGLESVEGLATYYRIADFAPATSAVAVVTADNGGVEATNAFESENSMWMVAHSNGSPVAIAVSDEAKDEIGAGRGGIYVYYFSGWYLSLLAYPASGESEPSYDRKAFLSGLAMGLCGKGNPTFEGSGKMLYNGVELPALPEWDKVKYPYAYITDGGVIARDSRLLRCTDTPLYAWHYEDTSMGDLFSGVSSYGVVAHYLGYRYDADSETWEFRAQSSLIFSHVYLPIWCNTDMEEIIKKDETDELTGAIGLYASDPVPVEDTFTKGYHVGAELRRKRVLPVAYLYNDIPLPKQPVWDKEAEPYAVIFQNSAKNYCFWTGSSPVKVLNSGKVNGMFLEYRVAERWQWREKSKPLISTDAPLWANYDVYNSDGTTLLLAASDPTPLFTYPVFDDWLYNGEVFPALPEWDKTNYPYAFISNGSLVVTKTLPHSHNDEYPRMAWDIADGVHAIRYSANGMRTEWNAPYSMNGAVNYQEGLATWANFDVYGTDGTLYLAASNPVPVHK